jgi:hypothetical protein
MEAAVKTSMSATFHRRPFGMAISLLSKNCVKIPRDRKRKYRHF